MGVTGGTTPSPTRWCSRTSSRGRARPPWCATRWRPPDASDGAFRLTLATPRELGGGGGPGTNPEQLFAAGYSACFIGAMKAVGARRKLAVPADVKVDATVAIGPMTGKEGAFGIAVTMQVHIPGFERAAAEELVAAAHEVCPYSNATRGNIDVAFTIV